MLFIQSSPACDTFPVVRHMVIPTYLHEEVVGGQIEIGSVLTSPQEDQRLVLKGDAVLVEEVGTPFLILGTDLDSRAGRDGDLECPASR